MAVAREIRHGRRCRHATMRATPLRRATTTVRPSAAAAATATHVVVAAAALRAHERVARGLCHALPLRVQKRREAAACELQHTRARVAALGVVQQQAAHLLGGGELRGGPVCGRATVGRRHAHQPIAVRRLCGDVSR